MHCISRKNIVLMRFQKRRVELSRLVAAFSCSFSSPRRFSASVRTTNGWPVTNSYPISFLCKTKKPKHATIVHRKLK
jgi:hypothetical protein